MDKEDVEGGRGREGREGKWFLGPEWGSHPQTLFLIKKKVTPWLLLSEIKVFPE